ncbi:MAG: hypothetical protein HOW97_18910 [Catenulispora sp.]|nr:hypothetical protein [Catenulispora sp.]
MVVKEAGFADGSIYAYLENKGSKEIAITPGFVAYDASGAKLDENDTTTSSAFYLLPPGSTTFVATSVNDQSVTKVEAKPTVADSAEIPKHGPGTLEVTGVELSDTTAHISIKNTYQQDVSDAAIHLVCKDDAGKLAAIMPEDKFDAPKGGTAKVDTPVGDNNGKGYKGCEAYPYVVAKTTFSG